MAKKPEKRKFIVRPKRPILTKVAKQSGLLKSEVERVVIAMTKSIIEELAAGREVKFGSLGKFYNKKLAPRTGWDPVRKRKKEFGTRFFPSFKYGNTIKRAIREALESKA